MRINRAVLVWSFGFVVTGASAAVDGWVAIELREKRVPAVRNATLDDAKGAALAHRGTGFPTGMDVESANLTQPGGGEFTESFQN